MARPIKKDQNEIQQSNYFTTARYDYTTTEKRVLYRIAEKAFQYRLQNKAWFDEHEGEYVSKQHVVFTMPIKDFMPPAQADDAGGIDYQLVVDAFQSLTEKRISFVGKDCFSFGGILNFADHNQGEGTVTFMVHKFVWQSALDFTRGFTMLDLATAIKLKSAYSMRFYELGKQWINKGQCTITLTEFREMFCCKDKYPLPYNIKRYIIDVAKAELDKSADISFDYETNYKGHAIFGFTFFFRTLNPRKTTQSQTEKEIKKQYLYIIRPEIRNWLAHKMGLSLKQIRNNSATIYAFQMATGNNAIDELEEVFEFLARSTKTDKKPQENVGAFMASLKRKTTHYQKIK